MPNILKPLVIFAFGTQEKNTDNKKISTVFHTVLPSVLYPTSTATIFAKDAHAQ